MSLHDQETTIGALEEIKYRIETDLFRFLNTLERSVDNGEFELDVEKVRETLMNSWQEVIDSTDPDNLSLGCVIEELVTQLME